MLEQAATDTETALQSINPAGETFAVFELLKDVQIDQELRAVPFYRKTSLAECADLLSERMKEVCA